jgi:CheY-like chemotaxis protein
VALCDPHAALERLAVGSFDAVLCDLLMPGMDGMEIHAELVRRSPDVARRMLFLTGGAFTARARKFMEEHSARCLDKPFEPEVLKARIAEAVERFAGNLRS